MCGRFTQRFSWQQVHDYMNLPGEPVELTPRYNVAPGQNAAPGDAIETCTVLTTQANEAMKPIHHRMPVILPEDAFAPWLAGEDVALDPCSAEAITVRPVSRWVNNAAHEGPRCIEPVPAN